jgi:tetratricopeptide (TPR) repeat protein
MQPNRDSQASGRAGRVSGRAYFIFLVVLAAALRVAYVLTSRGSPFFDHLDLDTKFYDAWARQISGGDWIGHEVFFMGPLYPYFLALVYKAFGPSILAAKLVQSLVGSLTAGFTFLLGREVFGRRVGIIAGFLAAVYVPFIFTDSLLLYPVLATLLNTVMLYLLYCGIRRSSSRVFLGSGVFAGFSAAGNASVLAFAPLAAGYIVLCRKWTRAAAVRKAAIFAAGIALVVLPILARNYVVGRDLVPLTSNAGLNFYIGNSAKATGAYVKPEGLDIYADPEGKAIAERDLGRPLKPSQVSAYWTDRALAYVRSHPGDFLRNVVRKFFFFWSVYEIPQIEHLPFEQQYSWILKLPTPSFGIVCPLGVLGIVLALRRRSDAWPLFLFIAAYSASIIAFFVVARYRLPAVTALMVFAACYVVWLVSESARGRWRPVAYSLIAFVVVFVLVHINFYRIHPLNGFAQSHYRLGVILESKGDPAAALANYRRAVEMDPGIVPARVNLGILLSRQGKYEEAKRELAEAVRRDPGYDKALYNLGLVYAETGRNDSALVMYDRALEISPGYGLARLARAAASYELGDLAGAESLLVALRGDPALSEQARAQVAYLLNLLPERKAWTAGRQQPFERTSDGRLLRGDNLASLGLSARAIAAYLEAVSADSASAAAHLALGGAYLGRGDTGRAAEHLRCYIELTGGTPELRNRLRMLEGGR